MSIGRMTVRKERTGKVGLVERGNQEFSTGCGDLEMPICNISIKVSRAKK